MHTTTRRPWGLGRMAAYPSITVRQYTTVELEPTTQLGVFRDAAGDVLEMGQHGTVKGTKQMTESTNLDGKGDQDQSQDSEQD